MGYIDDFVSCFGVEAKDGRRSAVWRMWTHKNDVYLSSRSAREQFKISLHQPRKPGQESWRIAYNKPFHNKLKEKNIIMSDRVREKIAPPTHGHSNGLTRGVRIYFPESELRFGVKGWDTSSTEPVLTIPACSKESVRVVDLLFTNDISRFNELDPPLSASLGAEKIASRVLPKGDKVWLVHFTWNAANEQVTSEANWFRSQSATAGIDLNNGTPIRANPSETRIMITGVNEGTWFAVIDAAGDSPEANP